SFPLILIVSLTPACLRSLVPADVPSLVHNPNACRSSATKNSVPRALTSGSILENPAFTTTAWPEAACAGTSNAKIRRTSITQVAPRARFVRARQPNRMHLGRNLEITLRLPGLAYSFIHCDATITPPSALRGNHFRVKWPGQKAG